MGERNYITPDLVKEFVTECADHVDFLELNILALEKESGNFAIINEMFRAIHTLKGTSALLGFFAIAEFSHRFENLLDELRKASRAVTPPIIDLLLSSLDVMRDLVNDVACGGDATAIDTLPVIGRIDALLEGATPSPEPSALSGDASGAPSAEAGDRNDFSVSAMGGQPGQAVQSQSKSIDHSVRVNMQKLDSMLNLSSELAINKSTFDLIGKKIEVGDNIPAVMREFKVASIAMERAIAELHTVIMHARMVAIGTVFNRFLRIVRELARKRNKDIELFISGADTEIDKTIVEGIADPLLHLVLNAVDHGVETPGQRAAAGKPAGATIHLRASYESGNVIIEVIDDGRGMDVAAIKDKAVHKGIISREQADKMSHREAVNLIFLPGVSTAGQIDGISGRGVGMDVVKTSIDRLRGRIHVETVVGRGTRIALRLPLTMGMIETLMVSVGDEIFAIPVLAVSAVARIKNTDIMTVNGNETVLSKGRTMQVARLGTLFNVPAAPAKKKAEDPKFLVVFGVRNSSGTQAEIGIIVDSVQKKRKIVIKSLDDSVVGTQGFSGATVLGDGRAALVIDPVELADMVSQRNGGGA
jgi:two-component system chemotaxis sensor kinase CheA